MSITIDANLNFIQNKLSISSSRMALYTEKTVDKIIEEEAKAGNSKAVKYAKELYGNPEQLIKAFDLENPNNKFIILQDMNENEIMNIMPNVEKEGLLLGLNFFTQEKMLKMLESTPIEQLVNVALEVFPLDDILEMIPEKDLSKFMKNDDLDKDLVLKFIDKLPPEVLAQMIEAATGMPVEDLDPKALSKQIAGLDKDTYKDAMVAMDSNAKRSLISMMAKKDPEILQLFDSKNYTKALGTLQKPDMMQGTIALESEEILKMIGELPKELLSIVATQIDTKQFAKILVEDYQDLLADIIAA